MKLYWQSGQPEVCDICLRPIDGVFIDGATRRGSWAIMDVFCHEIFGTGLGPGKGQKYEKQKGGRWLKVDG